jgi:hypothetical protein
MPSTQLTEFVVRTPQLLGGDIYTEQVQDDTPGRTLTSQRQVLVRSIVLSEILYRGEYLPAYLVTGFDLKTKRHVSTYAATRRLWAATREV